MNPARSGGGLLGSLGGALDQLMGDQNCFDVQSVLTHELGHVIGLGDVEVDYNGVDYLVDGPPNATMLYVMGKGELTPRTLTQGEIDGARALAP